jgi:hypothetical protein
MLTGWVGVATSSPPPDHSLAPGSTLFNDIDLRNAIAEVWNMAARLARSMFAQAENLMGTQQRRCRAGIDFQIGPNGPISDCGGIDVAFRNSPSNLRHSINPTPDNRGLRGRSRRRQWPFLRY